MRWLTMSLAALLLVVVTAACEPTTSAKPERRPAKPTTSTTEATTTTTTIPTEPPVGPNGTTWYQAYDIYGQPVYLVANAVEPPPYECWRRMTGPETFDGLSTPGDCAAHLDGPGFSVPTPAACLDARRSQATNGSHYLATPLAIQVHDAADDQLLATEADGWAFANGLATPMGMTGGFATPVNLYISTGGSGTLTSGTSGDPRVQTLPQVSRTAATYRVTITCDIAGTTPGTWEAETFTVLV